MISIHYKGYGEMSHTLPVTLAGNSSTLSLESLTHAQLNVMLIDV